jgi:HD-like signal output (HDOD) protein
MFTPSLKDIFAMAAKLPAAPQVLSELAEILEDVNANTGDVARLLERDGPLAASILRISNSALFGTGGVGSIQEAVNRVGFGEVHRLVGYAATSTLADRALSFYNVEAEPLREHMVCNALAAEALATAAGANPRHSYTAGLLRPIGMLVLDRLARDKVALTDCFEASTDGTYSAWEPRTLHFRNAAVTAVVLNEWRFASEVVEAVRGHTLQPGAIPPSRGAALLNLAGWVSDQLGAGLRGERDLWEPTPAKLALAGISEETLRLQVDEVGSLFDRMQASLQ